MEKPGCSRLLTALLACALATLPALGGEVQPPAKVGEFDYTTFSSPHPYPPGSPIDPTVWTLEVSRPGATYIKVHFSKFDLAPGDTLEVISADGLERYVFTDQGYKNKGADFWVNSVLGEKAILRLTSTGGGGYGFDIDYFAYGIVPLFPDQDTGGTIASVCGTNDWQDVECYAASYPTEYERAKSAVLVLYNGSANCTGVKIGCPNQFMTNEHCVTSQFEVDLTEVRFEYQRSACNGGTVSFSESYLGDLFQQDNYTLDYCVFTTLGDSSNYAAAEIDNRLPPAGERLYITGHPSGGVKKLSLESTHSSNPTGFCEVDFSPINGRGSGTDVGYYCDTTNGSSGSPVWSGDTHKLIAIHHFGGCPNSGVRMDLIYPEIQSLLMPCQPPVCGNGVKEGDEECDGADLGGASCADQNCTGGTPTCTGGCTLDYSSCTGCPTCDNDGLCEVDEDCNGCPNDCFTGGGGTCGNDVCETADGEDCVSCPQDCNGVQNGRKASRWCCGDGDGFGPVGCGDSRCSSGGNTCSTVPGVSSCCGDGTCEGTEDGFNCEIDCGAPPCGDALCDGGAGENECTCPADCGSPAASEVVGSTCQDGLDNDCDGAADCADADCASEGACQCTLAPVGASCTSDADCCSNKCRGPSGGKTCKSA